MSELQRDIIMADKMDISIERVKKLNEPLLVIGLGGTGSDIVFNIKKTFAQRYELPRDKDGNLIPVPNQTDYLVIDSDVAGLEGFEAHEKIDITLLGMKAILANPEANLKDYEKKWINPRLKADSVGNGAGACRQAARLMLSRNYDKVRTAIHTKLTRLVQVAPGEAAGRPARINVVIAAGISGGTGSGTFLDIAQIVRSCLSSDSLGSLKHRITGYLALPDIACDKANHDPHLSIVFKSNGYAALKELDFWMCVNKHNTPFSVQYSTGTDGVVPWTRKPFDACVLMSGSNTDGTPFADCYNKMCDSVAENLLHYLSYETAPNGKSEYTYISYEDNLDTESNAIAKSYPLNYGYRAVGAYTKRIPKTDIVYYEGSKLLSVFVPPTDDNGNLVPNVDLLNDGNNVFRVGKIVGNLNDLLKNVSTHVALPALLNTPLDAMQNMNPKPHERANFANPNRWESDVLPPAMAKHAEAYLKNAWETFTSLAQSVITDPQQGPFSLQAYLSSKAENGLLTGLKTVLDDWKSKRANLEQKRSVHYQSCETAYPTFVRPPLLGKQRAIDNYMAALKNFYNQVRAQAFLNAFIPALERLVLRVEEYLNTSLRHMCVDLLKYHDLFEKTVRNAASPDGSNIYDLSSVRGKIDADYANNNLNNKFERLLLGALCTASLETMDNVDPHSSGVTFRYQHHHQDVFYAELRKVLDQCFGTANKQSLDDIMLQQVGADVSQQNAYMDTLLSSVLTNSNPLFAQNPSHADEPKAEFSYLSVPSDAKMFLERYSDKQLNPKLQPKPSEIKDHVYCMTSWDGMPLYRYSIMDSLENEYSASLQNAGLSMGIHLVYDGNTESNYQKNWAKLPSPRPYYMFGTSGTPFAQKEYQRVRDLVMQGIKNGLVSVDTSLPQPTITLRLQYTDTHKTTFKPSAMMIPEIDKICSATDPVTGNPIQPAQQLVNLRAYLATADTVMLTPNCSPSIMEAYTGLSGQSNNPWDPDVMANPLMMEKAKQNFETLSHEMAAAVISLYPMYVLGLEMQMDAARHAMQIILGIEGQKQIWEPRTAYASTFALLYIHGVISAGLKGYQYTDAAGQKVSMVEKQLLAKDLENELPVLKNACYLADLDPAHAVRADLKFLLAEKEAELENKAESESLTAEELQTLVERIDKFIARCQEDQAKYSSKRRDPGADQDRLQKIQKFYATMIDTVSSLKATYEDVLSSL